MHVLRTRLRLPTLLLALLVPLTLAQLPATATTEASVSGERTEPVLALVASLVLPGLGQILVDEVGRGVWFMVGCTGVWVLAWVVVPLLAGALIALSLGFAALCALPLTLGGFLAIPAYHVWAGVDAYRLARRHRAATADQLPVPAPAP